MATAVECSRCILVFLTDKYLNSVNCLVELKYAIECGKAFVFVRLEKEIDTGKLEVWIREVLFSAGHALFDIEDMKDLVNNNEHENQVAKIYKLAQAIRDVGAAQPEFDVYDLNDQVVARKRLLNAALDELEAKTGLARFQACSRCGKQYEEKESKIGECKFHSAYYVGGTIIAGRWVCCNQTEKDSAGCQDTVHTGEKREWVTDDDYGTNSWQPA